MTQPPALSRPRRRFRKRRAVLIAVAIALVLVGTFRLGEWFALARPIPLVEITQHYGTLRAGADADHRCIEQPDVPLICARLRLASDQPPPDLGTKVDGGFANIPPGTDDLDEPSWLYLRQMSS